MDEMAEQMSLWNGLQSNKSPGQGAQSIGSTTASNTTTSPLQQGFTSQPYMSGGYLGYPSSGTVTSTGGLGQQFFQYPPYPTASVPIYPYDSKEGILLTDKEGKQHFVPIRDISQQIGLEW